MTTIFGNGFTLDLLHWVGGIPGLKTTDLIPGPQQPSIKVYRPGEIALVEGPLWSREAFPKLFDFYESGEYAVPGKGLARIRDAEDPFLAICQHSKQVHFSPNLGKDDGVLTLALNDADDLIGPGPLQLRAYLWLLFQHNDALLRSKFGEKWASISDWPWVQRLRSLTNRHKCGFVSYNYDVVPEFALSVAIGKAVHAPPQRNAIRRNTPAIYKLHGSITWRSILVGAGPCPWMLLGSSVQAIDCSSDIEEAYPTSIENVFWPPELVPPGHVYEDAIHPQHSEIVDICRQGIVEADIINVIGLSFRPPDDVEFVTLCGGGLRNKRIVHCVPSRTASEKADVQRACELVTQAGGEYINCDPLVPEFDREWKMALGI